MALEGPLGGVWNGAGGVGWWSETVFERLFLVAHSDFLGTVRGTRGVGWGGGGPKLRIFFIAPIAFSI